MKWTVLILIILIIIILLIELFIVCIIIICAILFNNNKKQNKKNENETQLETREYSVSLGNVTLQLQGPQFSSVQSVYPLCGVLHVSMWISNGLASYSVYVPIFCLMFSGLI